jgi:adenylate cyclase
MNRIVSSLHFLRQKRSLLKNKSVTLFLFFSVFILALLLEQFHFQSLQSLNWRVTDTMVRYHAQHIKTDPDIVIISIDDASLAHMENLAGSWPWPRSIHAEIVEGISQQQPQAIVFDLSFVEKDVYRPESDALFNQALQGKNTIFFPLIRRPVQEDQHGPLLAQIAPQLGLQATPQVQAQARAAFMPPMAIDLNAWRLGTVNFINDIDGVGRRYAVYTDVYGWRVPSLPARVLQDLKYSVPQQDEIVLAWAGKKNPYPRIPYHELYQDLNRQNKQRSPFELSGKIVIIGTDASALHDIRVTPIDSLYSELDILATAIDNLKNNTQMRTLKSLDYLLICVALLGIITHMYLRSLHVLKIAAALGLVSVFLIYTAYAAIAHHLLIEVVTILSWTWSFFFCLALREYVLERQSRQHTVNLFSRFVNPHVVKELIHNHSLSRAGESREITVLFSDIRGFTTLCENRSPQEIVALLNHYFSLQVDVIFKHGGSLDKFIGDCIMAFWGAPLEDPDHARHAVEAALEMTHVLDQFKAELQSQNQHHLPDFDVGIGIHTGPAVVGLIGSEKRREYTAIGDTVNLASRIEGLTKGVAKILISRETRSACGTALDFTYVGSYKVKGRDQEVELFSPVIDKLTEFPPKNPSS